MSAPESAPAPNSAGAPPAPAAPASLVDERPEVLAAGAFAGGFLFALILRRFGG